MGGQIPSTAPRNEQELQSHNSVDEFQRHSEVEKQTREKIQCDATDPKSRTRQNQPPAYGDGGQDRHSSWGQRVGTEKEDEEEFRGWPTP